MAFKSGMPLGPDRNIGVDKTGMRESTSTILRAVTRARAAILSVAVTYVVSVAIGLVLAHTVNGLELAHRNKIVGTAQTNGGPHVRAGHPRARRCVLLGVLEFLEPLTPVGMVTSRSRSSKRLGLLALGSSEERRPQYSTRQG